MLPHLSHCLNAELRQLVDAVFAQESEWVRVAVLQHLLDNCGSHLTWAPRSLGECFKGLDAPDCWAEWPCMMAAEWHCPPNSPDTLCFLHVGLTVAPGEHASPTTIFSQGWHQA